MKKILLLLATLFGSLLVSQAQDLITTKKGEDIQAKILEVSSKEVKYKRFNNLEGPTFTLNKSDIVMVRYENGDKDIFEEDNTSLNARGEIREGMRYREYKNLYNHRLYLRDFRDAYSPGWAGVASFFIPGLGQGVAGEWGRALGVFAGDLGLSLLFYSAAGVGNSLYDYQTETGGEGAYAVAIGALVGMVVYDIWNICDAVKVAKIKNMYEQDLRSQRAALDIRVEPFLASTPSSVPGGFQTAAGLSFKIDF